MEENESTRYWQRQESASIGFLQGDTKEGRAILMNTCYVSGIQQPYHTESERLSYLPKATQLTRR